MQNLYDKIIFWHSSYLIFRKNAEAYVEENPLKLGGPGRIVEIDESCVSGVPKHHRGKHSDYQKWVIGGNCSINYAIYSDVKLLELDY